MDTKKEVIGGYTSYYRSQCEPCRVDAVACDLSNLGIMGFSKLNPLYLATRAYSFFKNVNNRPLRKIPSLQSLIEKV